MKCPTCGTKVLEVQSNCHQCGAIIRPTHTDEQMREPSHSQVLSADGEAPARVCRNCGTKVDVDARFCKNCATPILGAVSNNVPYSSAPSNRMALIIGGIVMAVVLVAGGITAILLLSGGGPTKESAIQTLRDFLSAYSRGDYEKALSYMRSERIERRVREQIRTGSVRPGEAGISINDISRLAEKGEWGKLTNYVDHMLSKRATLENANSRASSEPEQDWKREFARDYGVPAESCYALWDENSAPSDENQANLAIFYWNGKDLKLVGASKYGSF